MEENNLIQKISSEIHKSEEITGILRIRKANDVLREAYERPNPRQLWLSLFYEGEVTCLFADSGAGKSILAMQIAISIATKEPVLYFDFELSDKQFQMRYTDEEGNLYKMPPNLFRVEISRETLDVRNFESMVIQNIEDAAKKTDSKILIIDNLTYLCIASEKGDAAANLMMHLMQLKRKYGWTILILAHTPKRDLSRPITPNDLAGSKKLYNFFDAVFSIGKSAKDGNLRYIKQLKIRSGAMEYGGDNVIIYEVEKRNNFLGFFQLGWGIENEHLKESTEKNRIQLREKVKELYKEGRTQRFISAELGISLGCVNKYLK